jgi:peptide/nickel transport system permease protein
MMINKIRQNRLFQSIIRELKQDTVAQISLIVVTILTLIIFIGGSLVPTQNFQEVNIMDQYLAPLTDGHILGTDDGGRDIVLMLLVAARNSLWIALAVTVITLFVGIAFGVVTGYFGGRVDWMMMRVTDFIMVLPMLMIVIVLVTVIPRYNVWTLIGIISLFSWVGTTRLIRSRVLSESQRDYVKASKTSGTSHIKVMFREILPNLSSLLIAESTLMFAGNIGLETGLSFLGFGLPAGTPSLGTMLNAATDPNTMTARPWTWVPAAILILILVTAIVFIGQALRRVADQRQSGA